MRRSPAVLVLVLALLTALPALAQGGRFPSDDPDPRVGTPNDPGFDCSEPDDEDDVDACPSIYDEQYNLFGFAPESTRLTAMHGPGDPMVSGVSADLAWKTTTGDPRVAIAILDTGVRWHDTELRRKVWLNVGELPVPEGATTHDADGDGAVTVDDWIDDSRVTDANDNDLLDGQDLIRAFSDGTDADDNGYVDDIAGWDFFDDDNDPSDDSSYSAASGHGTGRGREAAAETDNAVGDAGVCPDCRVMMLREYDSFVLPGDRYAAATVYAVDNGALVQVVANGVLTNSASAREAAAHAAASGMALMHVSSDLNTANHNYPTNYRQSVFINGCVTDTHGLGTEVPGLQPVVDALGIIDSQVPPTTYFRQSNLTQHGEHAAVCFMAETGSQATGQAGGAAGLLHSRALEVFGEPLTSDEVKQLLTMTADDVTAADTGVVGTPDPAQDGFDPHFGYGRANLAAAVDAVGPGTVPPEAWIDDPAWWALVDPVTTTELEVRGHVAAERSAGWSYELQWAPGNAPLDTDFTTVAEGDGTAPVDELLGTISTADIAAAVPGAADGTPPSDPDERTFTVRLVATDADGNRGEDRKVYFAHHDPAAHNGWPIFTDSGGETSLVFADLDGDGTSEIIDADSSGRLWVRDHTGGTVPWFNDGEPFLLPPAFFHHPGSAAHTSGAVPAVTGGWRTPAVADIDGDLSADIVGTTFDGRVFVLDRHGVLLDGFPVSVDPALAANPTSTDHRKRGFLAAPTIADLDGDGTREVIAAALDGHLYVWAGDGTLHDGFPLRLADPAQEEFIGGELIGTPAVGDVDGDGDHLEPDEAFGRHPELRPRPDPGDVVRRNQVGRVGIVPRAGVEMDHPPFEPVRRRRASHQEEEGEEASGETRPAPERPILPNDAGPDPPLPGPAGHAAKTRLGCSSPPMSRPTATARPPWLAQHSVPYSAAPMTVAGLPFRSRPRLASGTRSSGRDPSPASSGRRNRSSASDFASSSSAPNGIAWSSVKGPDHRRRRPVTWAWQPSACPRSRATDRTYPPLPQVISSLAWSASGRSTSTSSSIQRGRAASSGGAPSRARS